VALIAYVNHPSRTDLVESAVEKPGLCNRVFDDALLDLCSSAMSMACSCSMSGRVLVRSS
jgi:hypothetical protein